MAEKRTDKTKHRLVEKRYELDLYKLLAIAAVAILVAVLIGSFFGGKIGYTSAVSDIEINTPEYCNVDRSGGEIAINCNELNVSADELCDVTSSKIKDSLRVLIVTSSDS